MAHIGTIGQKMTLEVTLTNIFEYVDYKFSYSGTTHYTYIMQDRVSNILVWKTTAIMSVCLDEQNGSWYPFRKGDKIKITGTIKEHSEYKDTPQTILNRCKYSLIQKAVTQEELEQLKQEEQLASLNGKDFIWEMPYKQYKERYSDCETLAGSFRKPDQKNRTATIAVIIREGRLKPSGTRGEHYSGYQMENQNGQKITYRAVCEENALKRVQKDFPQDSWKCVKIFDYTKYASWCN